MNIMYDIDPKRITEDQFVVLIEISQGSKKKYEIDKETGLLSLDRYLATSFRYPVNYGFIPLTHCEDNDPLDVFVLSQEPLDPMVLVNCRPLGVIRMIDNGELDEKLIAVPVRDPLMDQYQDIKDLPQSLVAEIEHFLLHYKDLDKKTVSIEKIEGKQEAKNAIKRSLVAYQEITKK
ncbi:MAG: Inorganic pyrophosphatase [Candidatus Phytoplasma pruni]